MAQSNAVTTASNFSTNKHKTAKLAPPSWRRRQLRVLSDPAGFFRHLFPHKRQRIHEYLQTLRFERFPAFQHRVQSRVWRYIVQRQSRKRAGTHKHFLRQSLTYPRNRALDDEAGRSNRKMTYQSGSGSYSDYGDGYGQGDTGRQPGSRRAKLKGYFKAANDLRQDFMGHYNSGWDNRDSHFEEFGEGVPGAYPDNAVIQGGSEEMILFAGYSRHHVKKKLRPPPVIQNQPPGQEASTAEDEYWHQKWEEYEDDNAVVDVDVRGWLFSPHKGPMTRRQRFYLSLSRQLAGLPTAQRTPGGSASSSRATSPRPLHRDRLSEKFEEHTTKHEAEAVAREAERILRKGEAEAEIAGRGGYSEMPQDSDDNDSVDRPQSTDRLSRHASPHQLRQLAAKNRSSQDDDDSLIKPLETRASWPQPGNMNSEQTSIAHANLLARMRPFLATPIANAPISAFFFNDTLSRQRTVYTNASGHFALRAALDFVPTHVRILASEKLSATEEVSVTEKRGVTVVSDIDDTVKHTAMTSGAREAFRNAFIRDLGDLTIDGVGEWYTKLSKLGVKFHYVSNSPWQLYATLANYLSLAGLPSGSIHLKLYSGMLQGIFEPVAERKKGTMDRLARDFPERKFILIGDSGEADLEVYTDFVVENPGRVLAVYIRDVTTSGLAGNADGPMGSPRMEQQSDPQRSAAFSSRVASVSENVSDPDLKAAIEASLKDLELDDKKNRPALPPRKSTGSSVNPLQTTQSAIEDLIDFSEDNPAPPAFPPRVSRSRTDPVVSPITGENSERRISSSSTSGQKGVAPPPPVKPRVLRGSQSGPVSEENPTNQSDTAETSDRKSRPPKPRRPSSTVQSSQSSATDTTGNQGEAQENTAPKRPKPPPPARDSSYASLARQKLSSAYNQLPSTTSMWPGSSADGSGEQAQNDSGDAQKAAASKPAPPPPPPPRRGIASYPVAAAQYATSRVGSAWSSYSTPTTQREGSPGPPPTAASKREDLWRRRWATAEQTLRSKGVVLRSWRVGSDVTNESIKLVEQALRDMKNTAGGQQ